MIIIDNLLQVANQIETERGVEKEILFSAIEQALVSAYMKRIDDDIEVLCELNPQTGEAFLFQSKKVVTTVKLPEFEISKKEAAIIDHASKVGDTVNVLIKTHAFGRVAAQTAKQVIAQRLREAEKNSIYEEFKDKVGKVINGVVQQVDQYSCLVNLGRTESVLNRRDQVFGESYKPKDRIKVYVVSVEKESKGNQIVISRTHPGLVRCLFQQEIPEIQDEIIEVKSVSRDAGKRAKVAVATNNPAISAVGTCVGQMGARIQTIIKELGGEKVDVLEWDVDPAKFISNSLKPAQVTKVIIQDHEKKEATVIVPQDQLSLAIGKGGINVRLSVNLTNWNLNVITEADYDGDDLMSDQRDELSLIDKMKLENKKNESEEDAVLQSELTSDALVPADDFDQDMDSDEESGLIEISLLAEMLNMNEEELRKIAAKHCIDIGAEDQNLSLEQVAKIKEQLSN
jgi:N utilization substance protein A